MAETGGSLVPGGRLGLMHGEPACNWRLEELADASAMSRTTFAIRFRTTAGLPALTYLAEWRMRLAECALRDGATPVAVIAESCTMTPIAQVSTHQGWRNKSLARLNARKRITVS